MRTRLMWCVATIVLATLATSALAGGEVNLFYGKKDMDFGLDLSSVPSDAQPAISDLEDQDEWGLLTTWGHDWPVALAVDFLSSSQDTSLRYTYAPQTYGTPTYTLKADVSTMELDVGVRKYFLEKVQVYVGGGLAWIDAEVEFVVDETSIREKEGDSGVGWWLNAGVVWRAGRHFNVGADIRYSDGSGEFNQTFDEKVDLGGTHYGLFVGGRW